MKCGGGHVTQFFIQPHEQHISCILIFLVTCNLEMAKHVTAIIAFLCSII